MSVRQLRSLRMTLAVMTAMLLLAQSLQSLSPVAAQDAKNVEVQIVDFAFEPAEVRVNAGTTVTWVNNGARPHTVTAEDGSFDSGRLDPGEQFSFTFEQPGTLAYHCGFHPDMQGTVVVEAAGADSHEIPELAAEPSPIAGVGTDENSLLTTAQQDGLPAALHAGNCGNIGLEIASLAPAFVPSSARVGSSQSLPGANSFSPVPVTLDAMLAEDHAVVISGADQEPIACGEIGGYLTDAGALIVGLRSESSTGLGGVAFLSPSDTQTQTNISLFLTGDALGGDAAVPVEASLQQDETPIAEVDATELPEEDEPTAVPTERPAPTPTPTPAPGSSQSNPAPIGTRLETQGLAVTVNSAYFDYSFANAIPRGGYKVLILDVTIENVSDGNRGYAASRFGGVDAVTGNTYNPVTLDNVGALLTDGELQPGEFVSGTALIEVQETATNVIVKYDADILGDEDLYWS